MVLAGDCVLRVAAEGTRFSIPEIDLGIPLAWGGIPRLVREIGPALTKELVMTCRPFDAEEALGAGFLNRVVSAGELDPAVEEMAAMLASKAKLALLATNATPTPSPRRWSARCAAGPTPMASSPGSATRRETSRRRATWHG